MFLSQTSMRDLDRFHALVLSIQEGPSLSDDAHAPILQEALRELGARYPGVHVPCWFAREDSLSLLVDMGRADEDILRLVLHLKRVLRDRVGGGLQWRWSYEEIAGADKDQRERLLSMWPELRAENA
jgi:hypothetical protein